MESNRLPHSSTWWQPLLVLMIVGVIAAAGGYYLFVPKSNGDANTIKESRPQTTMLPNTVILNGRSFSPAVLTVSPGVVVTWINNSGDVATVNSNPHPSHTNYPPLNLGKFDNGESLSLTFEQPGTYGYHNHLNPGQTGQIVVR